MRARGDSGIWELFIPELAAGSMYKFEIRSRIDNQLLLKTDPYGRSFELRPGTASIVTSDKEYQWNDDAWIDHREKRDWLHEPMLIYEVYLGSW